MMTSAKIQNKPCKGIFVSLEGFCCRLGRRKPNSHRGDCEVKGDDGQVDERTCAQCSEACEAHRHIQANVVELDGRAKAEEHRAGESCRRPFWRQCGLPVLRRRTENESLTAQGVGR